MTELPLRLRRALIAAATLTLLGASASAAGASPKTDPATASTTNVSGLGGQTKTVDVTSTSLGIKSISWWENADKPCKLRIKARSFEDASKTYALGNGTVDICGGIANSGSEKTVHFEDNPRYYLRGISVCTTDKKDSSKDRLKGIKIYPAKVTKNGTVTALTTYEKVERTNCKIWHPPVYCPAGHVAFGIKVRHNGDWFRGLALECRKIVN